MRSAEYHFLIDLVVAIAMTIGFAGCHRNSGQSAVQEVEMRFELLRAAELFRKTWGEPPRPLKWETLSRWLDERCGPMELAPAFRRSDLNADYLDQDELLVLLLSGIYVGEEYGEFGWISIRYLSHRNIRCPSTSFDADLIFVQDADSDGWMEYSVPGREGFTYYWDEFGGISVARRHEWKSE